MASKYDKTYPRRVKPLVELALQGMDGLFWYDLARQEIDEICRREGWNVEHFVSILAVTSPQVAVRRNVRITLQYMAHGEFLANVLGNVKRSVEIWESEQTIRGQKTSAFQRAILGDQTAVVLDTHMANALHVPQKAFARRFAVERCQRRVEQVAEVLDMSPRSAQACIWFGQKRSVNENPEPFPLLWEYGHFLYQGRKFPSSGPIPHIDEATARNELEKQ